MVLSQPIDSIRLRCRSNSTITLDRPWPPTSPLPEPSPTALQSLAEPLGRAAEVLSHALLSGHKLLCCGNGGSAADSAHFTAEIAGRYVLHRPGFPAIDLTSQHSLYTALCNDYPPEEVFARMVQAQGTPEDVLVVFSTSGRSANVRLALQAARAKGMKTIAFLGRDGGSCKGLADVELIVSSNLTAPHPGGPSPPLSHTL